MRRLRANLFVVLFCIEISLKAQATIVVQDFDGGSPTWNYSNDVTFFNNGWGSGYYGLIDISSAAPLNNTNFASIIFGENDLDDNPDGTSGFATTDFNDVDLSTYRSVTLKFAWDVVGYNASNDDAKYEVIYDGISQGEIFLVDGGTDPEDGEGTVTINVPDEVNMLDLKIFIRNNGQTGYSGFDNFEISGILTVANPTNESVSVMSQTQLNLSWDDNANNDNVLLAFNTSNSFGDPIDGNTYNPGDNLGGATVLQYSSTDSYSHTGLNTYTNYYYKIWSYDGSEYSTGIEFSGITLATLIITEIMNNPNAVADADGEWFEIYNAGSATVDIDGYVIKDAGSDTHTISNGGALNIISGGFFVLGDNPDTGTNGDLTIDYQYSGITLTNTSDEIMLFFSDGTTLIDQVIYDNGATFPNHDGASMILTDLSTDNSIGSSWGTSTLREGTFVGVIGDKGSPGILGSDAALPVELTTFTGQFANNAVELNWQTATETNNAGFQVQRLVSDWETLTFIPGAGNSNSPKNYSYSDGNLPNVDEVSYRLKQIDNDGTTAYSKVVDVDLTSITDVEDENLKYEFALNQNYPNPFNPTTTIDFTLPGVETQHAVSLQTKLTVYNLLGQKVRTLVNEAKPAGQYEVQFNASSLPSGIYFYTLNYGSFTQIRKLILMK